MPARRAEHDCSRETALHPAYLALKIFGLSLEGANATLHVTFALLSL